ncbi:MAG: DNA gyrase subunit B [Omnitrophica WOR_2 bacterium RIFCSPLOWO2_02_FULL_63_16]|nr:MAG: DNA gyrase subunit B [Omnitrophica WOR_2 bacterium GWA2_63_20]OGX17677.1 MAG: DNA gyrase subunit B [Omnitrophica WOR_2 bacterium GWF2_63_9]OGX32461.1 MAG: DNA gyrase subunit B [Omnitrophica WOR_2 bacterium RIFCSPHIGHO2_12_FULL_64_13]OGX36267.1 MAG: DNA gyrase subunit B [Omnitrophica WOR_2 bacterium RIFCSPHIGHO2_02_FULL_63_39]OGX46126.1 MAG: DNA gyrase subunit B [Omnitrophica WOR_2 bacterium RIFCSPLOWO2_02_FULL_63_16]
MYIGDTSTRGLHHLVEEVVDNSVDEAMAGFCKKIDVIVHRDNSVTVIDDGRGIPVDLHKTEKKSALEVVLTKLHAGGKFDSRTYKVAGGLHGVGVSVVNALSEWLEAEVKRDGKAYRQRYERGKPTTQLTLLGKASGTGTRIIFKADREIFKSGIVYNYDTLSNRLREIAFLNKGLTVSLADERSEKSVTYKFDGGIKEFVEHLNKSKTPLHQAVYFEDAREDVQVEVALQYNDGFAEHLFSFANNINTVDGGTHLSGFKSALTRCINQYCKAKNLFKGDAITIEGEDTRAGLTAVVSVKIPQPQFEGQTKAKLGSPEVEGIVASAANEKLSTFLEEHPSIASKIADKCLLEARARERARHERDLVRRKGLLESSTLPGKLADCSERDPALCEVYIVEGDSAGGCFAGDTKVALADGRKLSFRELVEEQKAGKQNFCYTILPDGRAGIEKTLHVRKTRSGAEVVEVLLDNGERVVCTPDHLFMRRDGSYRQATDLRPGESLMPLRRQRSRIERWVTIEGYEMVFDPAQQRWVFTHVLADEHNLRHGVYQENAGPHRHHLDFNKQNNNPTNLRRLTKAEHLEEHQRHAAATLRRPEVVEKVRRLHRTPQFRERIRQKMLEPEMRTALSVRAKRQWEDAAYKQYMVEKFLEFYRSSSAYRVQSGRRLLQAQKAYWNSAENRAQQAERVRSFFQQHPETRKAFSLQAKRQWADPKLRRWRSEKTREQWTPEFRQGRKRVYDQTYLNYSLRFLADVVERTGGATAYDEWRRRKRNNNLLKYETLCQRFFDGNEPRLLQAAENYNHRVVSVRKLRERTDVYDFEVPGTHNFALASGVFVHNSAKMGRDRRFQAILPIKGKILNVEKARLEKVLTNEEIRTIITALGCGVGNEFDLAKLRYHKILLMADADVDGNHIRTLLLTLFYRQMPKLIEEGHIYIAQPPLYKIKRGKREEYIETEDDLSNLLIELGAEGQTLIHLKTKRSFKDKTLLEIMRLLTEVEALVKGISRHRVELGEYFQRLDRKRGFPAHYVRLDGEAHFFYSDEELATFAQKHELDLDELEKASSGAKAQYAELLEATELEAIRKKLDKLDLALDEYVPADSKPAYKLVGETTQQTFTGLRDVLRAVQEAGRQGMTIQRYKGLGEMNPSQLWETTMDPAKRTILKVALEDSVEAERMFTTLMGEAVEPRKQFIEEHALEVKNLDI